MYNKYNYMYMCESTFQKRWRIHKNIKLKVLQLNKNISINKYYKNGALSNL